MRRKKPILTQKESSGVDRQKATGKHGQAENQKNVYSAKKTLRSGKHDGTVSLFLQTFLLGSPCPICFAHTGVQYKQQKSYLQKQCKTNTPSYRPMNRGEVFLPCDYCVYTNSIPKGDRFFQGKREANLSPSQKAGFEAPQRFCRKVCGNFDISYVPSSTGATQKQEKQSEIETDIFYSIAKSTIESAETIDQMMNVQRWIEATLDNFIKNASTPNIAWYQVRKDLRKAVNTHFQKMENNHVEM